MEPWVSCRWMMVDLGGNASRVLWWQRPQLAIPPPPQVSCELPAHASCLSGARRTSCQGPMLSFILFEMLQESKRPEGHHHFSKHAESAPQSDLKPFSRFVFQSIFLYLLLGVRLWRLCWQKSRFLYLYYSSDKQHQNRMKVTQSSNS